MDSIVYIIIKTCFDIDLSRQKLHRRLTTHSPSRPGTPSVVSLLYDYYGNKSRCGRGLEAAWAEAAARARRGKPTIASSSSLI